MEDGVDAVSKTGLECARASAKHHRSEAAKLRREAKTQEQSLGRHSPWKRETSWRQWARRAIEGQCSLADEHDSIAATFDELASDLLEEP